MNRRIAISGLLLSSVLAMGYILTGKPLASESIIPAQSQSVIKNSFETLYANYSREQKAFIQEFADKITAKLPDDADDELITLAINHYVFNYVKPTRAASSPDGITVMKTRQATCGGAIMMASDLLRVFGIKSWPVYGVGGARNAHSMLDVKLRNGRQIFIDPYSGVVFRSEGRTLSFQETLEAVRQGTAEAYYARQNLNTDDSVEPMPSFKAGYSRTPHKGIRLPESFFEKEDWMVRLNIVGVAGSGQVDTLIMTMQPGDAFGMAGWTKPVPRYPRPWQKLAETKQNGERVGWTHKLGASGHGYRINHAYRLTELRPGQTYTIRFEVAVAYKATYETWMDNTQPTFSFAMIDPPGPPHHVTLQRKNYDRDNYRPQIAEYTFTAERPVHIVTLNGTGNFTIGSIALMSERNEKSSPPGVHRQMSAKPAHHIRVFGAENLEIKDDKGNLINLNADGAAKGHVPSAKFFWLAQFTYDLILKTNTTYTVDIKPWKSPVDIEIITGTNTSHTNAVRYLDIDLPTDTTARLAFTPQGFEILRYDDDNDNIFESSIEPTASVSGEQANDITAPVISVEVTPQNSEILVTVTAEDNQTGVKAIYYAESNSEFKKYVEPILVDPAVNPIVHIYANDNAGNRGHLIHEFVSKSY